MHQSCVKSLTLTRLQIDENEETIFIDRFSMVFFMKHKKLVGMYFMHTLHVLDIMLFHKDYFLYIATIFQLDTFISCVSNKTVPVHEPFIACITRDETVFHYARRWSLTKHLCSPRCSKGAGQVSQKNWNVKVTVRLAIALKWPSWENILISYWELHTSLRSKRHGLLFP